MTPVDGPEPILQWWAIKPFIRWQCVALKWFNNKTYWKTVYIELNWTLKNHPQQWFKLGEYVWHSALWVKLCWRVVIGGFTKMIPSGPIFRNLNYFRQNIWRLSSVQFHFWYIFGTSWTQPTTAEAFTIESVSIQAGCRKDVNEVLRTSWM